MRDLSGKVALVTGGTRNVGKGIAQSLMEAGATVYITGRSITEKDVPKTDSSGGKANPIPCDHRNDSEVKAVFDLIIRDEGKVDLLVNNAWGGYARLRNRSENKGFKWKEVFWNQPIGLWDEMFTVGVRSNFVASSLAARHMIEAGSGIIVNISFFSSKKYYGNAIYGVAKAAVDKMTEDMAVELKKHKVTCVSVYPGYIDDRKKAPNPKKESSQFVGRAVAALVGDDLVIKKTGKILIAADLGIEYGFTDTDGSQPVPYDTIP